MTARLPVRPHLRPKPLPGLRSRLTPETLAKLPEALAIELTMVPVIEQVDRATHPRGWGYDLTRFVPLAEAEALGWAGQA